ncbi:hypothetical protein Acsp04_65640 [Actinomadura sp. NBRC 104425]|nr:hypothetical protein Acsp04_65640 [Actinomadura sp. NBRC 104425]
MTAAKPQTHEHAADDPAPTRTQERDAKIHRTWPRPPQQADPTQTTTAAAPPFPACLAALNRPVEPPVRRTETVLSAQTTPALWDVGSCSRLISFGGGLSRSVCEHPHARTHQPGLPPVRQPASALKKANAYAAAAGGCCAP